MAGEGRKVFSDGEVLSAADVNDYLMDQAVMRFADSAARSSAIGTPTEGMVTYLDDVNQIEVYDGNAWVDQQAPILSEGTAGQYLQSNGTAGSQWVDLEIADDIITTEGDLIVGTTGGTAVRLPIGAQDTVLTSNGSAVVWGAGAAGGGEIAYLAIDGEFTEVAASLSSVLTYDFSFPAATFSVALLDVNGDLVAEFSSNQSGLTLSADVEKIIMFNDSGSDALLIRSNPVLEETTGASFTTITSTQSVTLATDHFAFIIGGGGGAGGGTVDGSRNAAGGSGGGSGYIATGLVPAGTYTATIGAGGSGGTGLSAGTSGGTTSIHTITALGGDGGGAPSITTTGISGDGGDGGSGGSSGGAVGDARNGGHVAGGSNGSDGNLGDVGAGGIAGAVGIGSGVENYTESLLADVFNYVGGRGARVSGAASNGTTGPAGTAGAGGGGGEISWSGPGSSTGGDGGDGVILLVEVV